MTEFRPVVILDDSYEDRFFLKRNLRKVDQSLRFIEFKYAEDALNWAITFTDHDPLLIFVDLNLPRSTGFDFLNRLRELRADLVANATIYAMSNSIDPEDRDRAESMDQVTKFFIKPIRNDVLAAHL